MPYQTVDLKQHPDVLAIIRAADPGYRKHRAIICTTDRVHLSNTYWEGGSRSTYIAVDLATKVSRGAPQYNPPQFGGPREAPVVELPPGVVIVTVGIFCGKTATAQVNVRPDDIAKALPQF